MMLNTMGRPEDLQHELRRREQEELNNKKRNVANVMET